MRKVVVLLIAMIILGCSKNNDEKIVLTCGLGMNPDALRYGIEVNHDKVFYCEEIPKKKGKYNYYQANFDSKEFLKFKKDFEILFKQKIVLRDIVDGKPYRLDISFNEEDKRTIKFYYSFLNDQEIALVNSIIKLKKLEFKQIKFHAFPMALLNEKLPPPPLPSGGNK
ncbi:hypothetical protein D0809_23580 [Flavobacterium circumlabens]|uniref:Uncharacterized protein n=1 Tax=Flavobacterium circumlabens TaxID=2133765 RepID=A0A4Y7U7J2_9FLAO|nr:hypothetical protein [Flavobacterium circumlabens]TCN50527.1 hypothetical protein EV142_1154 [Flavobacterium circumlabens]TEB41779.1 hypothetical protein D0809_23580 [Flavobacterium circumlabens]